MALATYSDLLAAVASWLMRSDLTDNIPDFVALCESRVNLQLRVREMETSDDLTPSAGVCALPTDYIEARRVVSNVDPISVLESISLDLAREMYSTARYPMFYAIQGSSLLVYPPNDSTITLDYYGTVPALSVSDPTNWLLTKAPQVYLYGSLLEAAPFLEDDNRLIMWANLFKAAIEDLHKADNRARFGKMVVRTRGYTP